jgi:hypothetical protein
VEAELRVVELVVARWRAEEEEGERTDARGENEQCGVFTSVSTVWYRRVEATRRRVPKDDQLEFKFKNLNF